MESSATFPNFALSSPVPPWLPDETFFSLASRYHRIAGNRLASTTCTALFGHWQQGSQHDFPNRIAEFCARTGNVFGDARTIALTRTVLPFYLPMRAPTEANQAIAAMLDARPLNLKFRLGILTSRFRANHPLKACAQCMDADMARHGVAYWHLDHQFPGVWICTEHQTYLMQSSVKSTGVGRFQWVLPEFAELHLDWISEKARSEANAAKAPALRLAHFAQQLAHLPVGIHLSSTCLAATYRIALIERGLKNKSAPLNMPRLAKDFAAAVLPLRAIPELSGLASNADEATPYLRRWLGTPQGGTHPLRHLAIIYWLFPDWDTFMRRYDAEGNWTSSPMHDCSQDEIQPDSRHRQLITMIQEGKSITSAATVLGINVRTAMAWAAKGGCQPARRPKKLKGDVLPDLISMLRSGVDKIDAARRFSISVTTVTRILQSEVGLQTSWRQARVAIAQEKARSAWLQGVSQIRDAGIAAIRAAQPAAYTWLYRHDREWLQRQCHGLQIQPQPPAGDRVDWHCRDLLLCEAVRKVVASIAERNGAKAIARWQIYQVLPDLKAKLDVLDRLPLTKAEIKRATRRRPTKTQSGDLF